jgi:hypothetical protein
MQKGLKWQKRKVNKDLSKKKKFIFGVEVGDFWFSHRIMDLRSQFLDYEPVLWISDSIRWPWIISHL